MTGLEAESVLDSEALPEQQEVTSVCARPLEPESPEVVLSDGELSIGTPGLGSPPTPTPTPPAISWWSR